MIVLALLAGCSPHDAVVDASYLVYLADKSSDNIVNYERSGRSIADKADKYGLTPIDFLTSGSVNFRPINRLMANRVRVGLVTACRLAICPTSLSPLSEKATIDGVVLLPSLLGITTGSLPSITATHELVVPKSIPIIFPIFMLY